MAEASISDRIYALEAEIARLKNEQSGPPPGGDTATDEGNDNPTGEKGPAEIPVSVEDVEAQAEELYEMRIRHEVETEDNIGKMVVIDVDSGDYAVDPDGIPSARLLRQRHSRARLFGIRIGYYEADTVGGTLERRLR